MSIQVIGQVTILKDDKNRYRIGISNKEIKDGEEQTIFMRVTVGFKKGIEVKNKTKIDIKNGFLTFFRIETGNLKEDGTPERKDFPKIMIMDFDIIEDGVDEVFHTKDYTQKNSIVENEYGGYYGFGDSSDDLPF